jgi:hypothetical protein
MRKTFIETGEFTAWVKEYLTDEQLAVLQQELLNDPETGAVMPGCGGLRKLRISVPKRGKGKRGGARVIYLHVPDLDQIYLVTVYGKDEQDDLSAEDKKLYRRLAGVLKQEAERSEGR